MNVLHHEIGKIPLEDTAEISRRVADRVKDDAIEKLESVGQTQLQCAFDDRTDKRLKAGVRVGDLQPVARADHTDGQHPGRMNNFNRSVDRIAADNFLVWMVFLPLRREIEGK